MPQKNKRTYHKSGLTPAKKKFAQEYAKTDNGTQSVKKAYGADTYTELSARHKASDLLTNPHVRHEIDIQKARLEQLATKAINRIDNLIDSEDESIATRNSHYVVDKIHGKEETSTRIDNLTINFGSPKPQTEYIEGEIA